MAPVPAGGLKILVADDDASNRDILVRLLSRLGAEVLAVADGEAALGLARERVLDLAFVDILMPRLGGLEFARARRAAEARSGLRPLFLVALSGGEDIGAALSAGFDIFLQKPISLPALRETLREAARREAAR